MTEQTNPFTTAVLERGAQLDPALAAALGIEASASWLSVPGLYHPELVVVTQDGAPQAALLVTHRPFTAYRKIARTWWQTPEALDAAVAALADHATAVGEIPVLKWEDAAGDLAEHATRNGFTAMPAPVRSGVGTELLSGYERWLSEIEHRQVPYYRQTTEYSCGPVALLMAQSAATGEPITRDAELQLWRRAAHQPGAGPIALGVYTDLSVYRPEVYISTEEVILGEHLLKPWELEVRELFDGEDERMAGELDIPITYRFFDLPEIAAELEAGSPVLLLVDEIYFHNETGSHWILAHAHRDGTFLVNDPWLDAENGDSWVDATDLPITAENIDKIAMWGDPAFRGLVVLRPNNETVEAAA